MSRWLVEATYRGELSQDEAATLLAHAVGTPQQVDHTKKTQLQQTTSTADRNGPTATETVMRLDSLWSIAERVLGDGDRWPEIAALNEGQADERRHPVPLRPKPLALDLHGSQTGLLLTRR